MNNSYIRNTRIQMLTKMALMGATMDQLREQASHWASKSTVNEYLDEVTSRLRKLKK